MHVKRVPLEKSSLHIKRRNDAPLIQRPLRRELVTPLSRKLKRGWYEPRFSSSGPPPGQRNHHDLLLVNTAVVHPLG